MNGFYLLISVLSICVGFLCSQTSNTYDAVSRTYVKQEDRIDRLISILEEWKEKDTTQTINGE